MTIAEILLCDFDAEAVSTRRVLVRVSVLGIYGPSADEPFGS